jgi:hypothetical protein
MESITSDFWRGAIGDSLTVTMSELVEKGALATRTDGS